MDLLRIFDSFVPPVSQSNRPLPNLTLRLLVLRILQQ